MSAINNHTIKILSQEYALHAKRGGTTLVVMDEETYALYHEVATRSGCIASTESEALRKYEELQPQRILVTSFHDNGLNTYANLKWAKDRGATVIFCLPGRLIRRAAPNWENSGISFDGMFYLVNNYVATLRAANQGTSGSYCEFGVFDGRTFSIAYHALNPRDHHL